MIEYKQGDLLASNAEAIVNTVNCVGVMGRGIALQFRNRFPDNYKYYSAACKRNDVVPGKVLVYETNSFINPRYIINFPTKRHWRGDSRIEDIDAGLTDLISVVKSRNISSIALPPLGCGLGGLDWEAVKKRIVDAFLKVDNVNVDIYEPIGAPPANDMVHNYKQPNMTNGRAALICLMRKYLDGLLDPEITLIEIQKLMFFLQEGGESLALNYTKGIYGPYAKKLSHVLNAIEGYFIYGYADGGDNPDKHIIIVPGTEKDATAFLDKYVETKKRIERVTDLVDGFESPFGMELLATVYWVMKYEAESLLDVTQKTYEWGSRKKNFTERQIKIAYNRLLDKGWIGNIGSL